MIAVRRSLSAASFLKALLKGQISSGDLRRHLELFFYMQRIEAGLLYGALVYCNNCTGVASLKCFAAWCYQFALIKQAKPHGGEKLCKCVSLLHTCFLLGRTLKGRNVKQTTICGVSASLFLICMAYLHCDLVLRVGLWNLWNLLTT